jgi:hypothetical protein
MTSSSGGGVDSGIRPSDPAGSGLPPVGDRLAIRPLILAWLLERLVRFGRDLLLIPVDAERVYGWASLPRAARRAPTHSAGSTSISRAGE